MNILAFDTSTELLSVALWQDGQVTSQDCNAEQQHAERTLPMLQALLQQAGLQLRDLDALAYDHGPGSFTGLRIGCGIAQGLAYGAGLPVIGINSLLALSEASGGNCVYACLDARMDQVFYAAYVRNDGGWQESISPGLCHPQDIPLPDGNGWLGIGSGFVAHGPALQQRLGARLTAIDPTPYPHAAAIARLAAIEAAAGRTLPPEQASLLYLRDKVALKIGEQPRK